MRDALMLLMMVFRVGFPEAVKARPEDAAGSTARPA